MSMSQAALVPRLIKAKRRYDLDAPPPQLFTHRARYLRGWLAWRGRLFPGARNRWIYQPGCPDGAGGLATGVLLLKMKPIGYMAAMAAETTLASADLAGLRKSLMVHAGGLLVLLAVTTLAVYKPRGMTPYGARTLNIQGSESITNAPRWVKVWGASSSPWCCWLAA